ncbi:MAG: hypothetical protein WC061_07285, partial [Melioribacteraceae bacterium]
MKKFLLGFLAITILTYGIINAQTDPKIASVIGAVNIDSLYQNLQYLTGEKPVTISSGTYYITSRNYIHYGNLIAEEYLLNRLKNYFPASASMQFF